MDLGTFTDETGIVQVELLRDCSARSFGVYGMDLSVLSDALSTVSGDGLREENGSLTGTFTAQEGDYLFIPVPDDGNLPVTVHGAAAEPETETAFDCVPAVRPTAGANTVTVTAFPPGPKTGLPASLARPAGQAPPPPPPPRGPPAWVS